MKTKNVITIFILSWIILYIFTNPVFAMENNQELILDSASLYKLSSDTKFISKVLQMPENEINLKKLAQTDFLVFHFEFSRRCSSVAEKHFPFQLQDLYTFYANAKQDLPKILNKDSEIYKKALGSLQLTYHKYKVVSTNIKYPIPGFEMEAIYNKDHYFYLRTWNWIDNIELPSIFDSISEPYGPDRADHIKSIIIGNYMCDFIQQHFVKPFPIDINMISIKEQNDLKIAKDLFFSEVGSDGWVK